ncbi:hypothetical protein [Reichenbachiella sp.]|uniref:hypothetical protein n=1 Tax=Reichenbachiella sp. TaxID=2184521 RepID=UPI003BB1A77C
MNRVANFLTSFEAIVLGMLVFTSYRLIELYSLFGRYLPLNDTIKVPASILVSVILSTSLLVFGCHIERFKISKYGTGNWISRLLLTTNLVLGFFFWTAYSDDGADDIFQSVLTLSFKNVIVVLFSIIDYSYCHLFISLYSERKIVADLQQSISQLETKESELQQRISKGSATLSQIIARDDPKVCPRCSKEFENINQRNGHIRSCKESIKPLISQI